MCVQRTPGTVHRSPGIVHVQGAGRGAGRACTAGGSGDAGQQEPGPHHHFTPARAQEHASPAPRAGRRDPHPARGVVLRPPLPLQPRHPLRVTSAPQTWHSVVDGHGCYVGWCGLRMAAVWNWCTHAPTHARINPPRHPYPADCLMVDNDDDDDGGEGSLSFFVELSL